MDALSLIDKLDSHRPKHFLAPVLDAERVRIHTLLNGIPYRFDVHSEPGWWVLKPTSKTRARRVGPPISMLDVMDYLRILPRFLVITLFRVRSSTWLVVPFNNADAEQRGWLNGEPRQLHLVRHRVQPFDVLVTRQLGNELIYHLRYCTADAGVVSKLLRDYLTESELPEVRFSTREFRSAWEVLQQHVREQKKQERLQVEAKRKMSVEERLRFHLAFMGAELDSWYESGEGYRVAWTHGKQEYSMDVARSGFIKSAGVCLEGTDRRHNLSSIVATMDEHRRLGRTY